MSIVKNIMEINDEIAGKGVTLVTVSKMRSIEEIKEAYDGGVRIFGENRPREMMEKYEVLPKDIQWHFIGSLQTNKVKYIAPFVALIQSVDSEKLLEVIQKEGQKRNRILDVLLELHVAQETTKHGWEESDLYAYLDTDSWKNMSHVRIRGIMGMATFSEDKQLIRGEFHRLKRIFDHVKKFYFSEENTFDTLSMGMSNDYGIAVEEGSTMIRIGSHIFNKQ